MKWKTETINDRQVIVSGDFRIITCRNGRCQLREAGRLLGTFTDADTAKGQAKFLLQQRAPQPAVRRARSAPDTEAQTQPRSASARGGTIHNKILGFSACAVVKALGQAGVKYAEADAILKRHGIEMPKASVGVQLGFGRNEKAWQRHGKPAPLDAEQVRKLRETTAPL